MIVPFKLLNFRVSGNFPETAWRTMNCHQATHPFLLVSGFLKRNRFVAYSWPPGDTWQYTNFGFLDEGPGGIGWTARRRGSIARFLPFWAFYHDFDRREIKG